MRYRLAWSIRLRAQGLKKGDEHPAYTPLRSVTTCIYISLAIDAVGQGTDNQIPCYFSSTR